jgi:hypothetical protein
MRKWIIRIGQDISKDRNLWLLNLLYDSQFKNFKYKDNNDDSNNSYLKTGCLGEYLDLRGMK